MGAYDCDCIENLLGDIRERRNIWDAIDGMPTAQPEADRIYSIMKDYYFEHKDEHDQSWQGGFAKCMNLIPNVWERREDE